MSRILRNRTVRAARGGNPPLAESRCRNSRRWHTAAAIASAELLSRRRRHVADRPEEISRRDCALEEDQDNPFTLELLVQAYYQTSQIDKLHEAEAKLRGTNVPTMEQALVVPAVRAKRPSSSLVVLVWCPHFDVPLWSGLSSRESGTSVLIRNVGVQ